MDFIDLRSDTVTRPTPGMRKAIAAAEVGDDVYGEDPTINALQDRVAAMLGKEAAVWVPTGTMANQIALGSLAGMGEEIICDRHCHVVNYEGGAISALWGVQSLVVDGPRGIFTAEAVKAVIRASQGDHDPRQKVVAIENTHNRGGGSIWPLAQLEAVADVARAGGLAVHLDGARIWNAHVATGIPLQQWCAKADTVSVCLSKGLGAPAGSLVATTRERMKAVRRLRKRVGGGLRQGCSPLRACTRSTIICSGLPRTMRAPESSRRAFRFPGMPWRRTSCSPTSPTRRRSSTRRKRKGC